MNSDRFLQKICPTCTGVGAHDAMFCARCGASVAHLEPTEPAAAQHQPVAQATAGRPARATGRREASRPVQDEAPVHTGAHGTLGAQGGMAATIGAVAGAVLRGALDGYLAGGDCAFRGPAPMGGALLCAEGHRVFEGATRFGAPVFEIDGNTLKAPGLLGRVLARLDEGEVRRGPSPWGEVIASIDGPHVYRGRSTWGAPIAYVQGGCAMMGVAAAYYLLGD